MPQNAFEPYNPLLLQYRPPQCLAQLSITCAEFGFHTTGIMDDQFNQLPANCSCKGNTLQIWQKTQDAIAAFKGLAPDSSAGQVAQLLHIDDDNQQFGQYTPCASFSMPLNLGLAARFGIPRIPEITLAAYIPYRVTTLKNIQWTQVNPRTTFEEIVAPDLLAEIERVGQMSLRTGWTRHGFGDMLIRAEYYKLFRQRKPWLQAVGLALRAGVLLPSGLKAAPDLLCASPFGYGGGFGMHASGLLHLCYRHGITLGIDAELLHLFGTTTQTRIKTDPAQTDLLLVTKIPVFREPGFVQRFTLFAEKSQNGGGLTGTLAYQYFKRSEDILYPCINGFDSIIINNAESLQESTAHSFVFMLAYDWAYHIDWNTVPSCSVFLKVGFNGKRAVIADTAGFAVGVSF